MVKRQETPAQVSPQIMSSVRPTTPLLQPTPEADAKLTQLAQKLGITREEVMDRVLDSIPDEEQPKESFTDQSLRKIETARRLGLAGEDTSDPINLKARLKILKDMDKEDAMSMKEMLQMGLLLRILPPQDNQQQGGGAQASQWQQTLNDLKTENEKLRQDMKEQYEKQRQEMRDLVLEKRIQDMGVKQEQTLGNITTQLEDLSSRVELIRSIPPSATPEQKKDAIAQLEDAGTQLERIKVTLGKFGLIPATPGVQTSALSDKGEVWRNPDGTTNKVMYMVDRITGAIEKGFDAWQKKTPEKGEFVETPAPARQEPQYTERRMSEEEYAEFLLSRSSLTPEQQQWLTNYRNYLLRQRAQPQTKVQEYKPPEPERREAAAPAVQQAEQPVGCMVCGRPEIYQNDLCEQCWNDQNRAPEQPKKGIIDRLKEQEEEELRRTRGLL